MTTHPHANLTAFSVTRILAYPSSTQTDAVEGSRELDAILNLLFSCSVTRMELEKEQMFRSFAWSQFTFHTGQRWCAFRLFLAATVFLGAATVLLVCGGASPWLVAPSAGSLVLLGGGFWHIDRRNRGLQQASIAALKALDAASGLPDTESGFPHPVRIFDVDEARRKSGFLLGGLDEGMAFSGAYFLAAIFGVYFSVMPFVVKGPLISSSTKQELERQDSDTEGGTHSNNPVMPAKTAGPAYPYNAPAAAPVHQPRFAPTTPFPWPQAMNPNVARRSLKPTPTPPLANPPISPNPGISATPTVAPAGAGKPAIAPAS